MSVRKIVFYLSFLLLLIFIFTGCSQVKLGGDYRGIWEGNIYSALYEKEVPVELRFDEHDFTITMNNELAVKGTFRYEEIILVGTATHILNNSTEEWEEMNDVDYPEYLRSYHYIYTMKGSDEMTISGSHLMAGISYGHYTFKKVNEGDGLPEETTE